MSPRFNGRPTVFGRERRRHLRWFGAGAARRRRGGVDTRNGTRGGTGGAAIPTPEVALPASTVTGETASFDEASFTQADFQNALATGGIIRFEAGTYDLGGWACVHTTAAVRIVGAGKGQTVFVGDASKTYGSRDNVGANNWFDASEVDLFMVPRARVEIVGVTFDHWKMVFPIAHANSGNLGDLGAILANLAADGATPNPYNAGVILNDVGFTNVGFVMAANQGAAVYNVYAYGCDLIDCNAGFMLQTDPVGDIYAYDCLFERITCPEENRGNGKPQHSTGVVFRLGENVSASTPYTGCVLQNLTLDTNVVWGTFESKLTCPEGGLVNARGWSGLKVKNCVIRHVGRDADGKSGTATDNLQAIYLKASDSEIDNVEFDRCWGSEGIVTIKGDASARNVLRNAHFHDGPATVPGENGGVPNQAMLSGVCFLEQTTIENVLVERSSAGSTLFMATYGQFGDGSPKTTGGLDVDRLTVVDSEVAAGILHLRGDQETVTADDVYVEGCTGDGGTVAVFDRNANDADITYGNLEWGGNPDSEAVSRGTAGTISGSEGTAQRADLATTADGGTLPVRGCAARA